MKKGSALLVVLGMIAFMVISAVAFSAYMRYSRLPSSYLLRTSTSRHLAKAALAEAIDLIDVSIGNNPHPGVGTAGYQYPRKTGAYRQRNYWYNHCFIGTNLLVNAEDTVSTLTMEGLAYIPPALINEARYFSRRSSAAVWKTLGFDSGRYAFSAIDVSDHFDINRLRAAVARDSSDRGRISLAHIFENEQHTGFATDPSVWDTFVARYYDPQKPYDTSKVPFTSLADLNLAINYSKPSKVISPFCRYLESGGGSDFVTSMTGEDSNMMRSMAFVTDSYFPRSSSAEKEEDNDYSLCDEENQPFDSAALESTASTVMTPYMYESKGATRLRESICGVGKIQLWDYLDEDSVPVSLALPTVERTPMVCAIETTLGQGTFKIMPSKAQEYDPKDTPNPTVGSKRSVIETLTFKVDPASLTSAFMGGKVKALLAFPFHRDEDANGSYEIDGRLSFFLSNPNLTFRTGGNDVLHFGVAPGLQQTGLSAPGVITIPFTKQSWNPSGVKDEQSALREFDFDLNHGAGPIAAWFQANDIVTVRYRWEQTYTEISDGVYDWLPKEKPEETPPEYAHCGLPPLDANGVVNASYQHDGTFLNMVKNLSGEEVALQACVWIRVKNSNNKFVDMVPACMKDDDDLNGCNSFSTPVGMFLKDVCGNPYPLMKFTGSKFMYSLEQLKGDLAAQGVDVGIGSTAVMVADPRYNYAPEHWFKMPGSFSKQGWLDNCQRGQNGRDRDIFMATSDMGYLQSVYELAFLPRLTDLRGIGNNTYYGDMQKLNGQNQFAATFNDALNSAFAWRTYRPFEQNGLSRDDFEGVGFNSEGNGFRVNPYSSSTPIIMAALANSPYNWMVASTNDTAPNALSQSDRKVDNFVKKYCFNEMGPSESRFDWKDLELVANQIKSAARGSVDGNWQAAFDNLDWAGDNSDFAGVNFEGQTVDLYDVDRKFLYGYWRDSFAVKQQLFLVFVRAEPLMMGGGAQGQTPPQLGARAVALVWRDPTINEKDPNAPHRTRILFYRQFD